MGLPDLSIKRPVTILMVFLGVVLLGFISWNRLPQELFPPITYPQITVATFYKDAAPEEIEILVTKILEEVIGTVSGLRRISSTSKEEVSLIIAEFDWGKNMDFAALGIREKIDLVKERLPRGCEDPIVMKFNPFELPVVVLNVTAEGLSPGNLLQFTRKVIKNELEKTDGVAAVQMSGGREREILIEVDQGRLQAAGVSVVTIADSLKKANLNYPAGTIEETFYEYMIRTIGEFEAVKDIKEIAIGSDEKAKNKQVANSQQSLAEEEEKENRLILLKDVAKVKDTLKEKTSISRYNKKDNVSLSIIKQAGANTLWVSDNIKQTLKQIRPDVPSQIKMEISYDQSKFIKSSISGVRDAAIGGGLLAFLVLLLFLRRVPSALIVTASIPISIMAVFSLMYFSGISLNMISLGGLALGVGMLVDNGIVVLENIFRHRKEGRSPKEASVSGAKEVSSAIVGSTLTTIAVFLPMAFVVGIAGQLFKELAFTVVFSLLSSLIVALTLIPIFASKVSTKKILERNPQTNPAITAGESIGKAYSGVLNSFFKNKFLGLFCVAVIFLLVMKMFVGLDKELLPKVDQGQFMIKVEMPPGTRLAVTDRVTGKIEDVLGVFPQIKSVTVTIGSTKEKETMSGNIETLGPHQGQIMVDLKPLAVYKRSKFAWVQAITRLFSKEATEQDARTISTADFLQEFKAKVQEKDLEGAELEYILQESVFQAAFQAGAPIVIETKGEDLVILKRISEHVQNGLGKIGGVYSVKSSLVAPAPEAKVYVKKDRAAQYDLSVSDIALTAQTAMKGFVATEFKEEGREIDIRVRLREQDRKDVKKVRRLIVHSPMDIEVPLASVAYMGIGKGPSQIQRLDQQRVILISANIFKRGFNEVADDINKMLGRLEKELPSGYAARLTGEHLKMRESFNSLRFALILSLVMVCMIMAAEFESLWQPFIIIFTFPLSIIGVAFALRWTNTPLSIMVVLGIIMLGGIVVNNGIVLIDYVNTLRRRDKYEALPAVMKASQARLRPILMTAMTTVFGLCPLALGLSQGAEIQIPMAITVMGGLIISTFLSLVVIPTIYLIFDKLFSLFKRKQKPLEQQLPKKEPPRQEPPRPEPPKDVPPKEVPPAPPAIQMPPPEPELPAEEPPELPAIQMPAPEEDLQEPGLPEEELPESPIIQIPMPEEDEFEPEEEQPEQEPPQEVPPTEPQVPKADTEGLNERQRKLLDYLLSNKRITRKEYVEIFATSVPTAARDLKELVDKGLIRGMGPKARGRYYELV